MKVYRQSESLLRPDEERGFVVYLTFDEAYLLNLVASLPNTIKERLKQLHVKPELADQAARTMTDLWLQLIDGVSE